MLAASGVCSLDDADVRDAMGLGGAFPGHDLGGIYFPYHSPVDGHRTGARVRLDKPIDDGPKYVMEPGCKHLFFGPGASGFLKDATVPVVFVEAEKSALALAAFAERAGRDYLIVATGGVDGWKRKQGKVTTQDGTPKWVTGPSPDLDLIFFKDRAVLIAFDSNTQTNPAVRRARAAFKKELAARGACVSFVAIPVESGINGPDDYLAMYGDAPMAALLDRTSGETDTLQHLVRSSGGDAQPSLANAITILRDATEWKGVLAFNEFTLHAVTRRSPPWAKEPDANWTDVDDIRAADWLQHHGINVNSHTTSEAVQAVAEQNRFNPIKDYLDRVAKNWDREPRLDTWLTDYLGVDETEFTKAVGARWMISAVARIFQPGCQADHVLLLEGEQGKRKSTALHTLAGTDWFTDHISDIDSKDARMELHGVWIVELGELASIRRADLEKVKTFITATHDNFRPPYGRRVQRVPRTNVFTGSTNAKTPFTDPTGSRRFWPVRCGHIDTDKIFDDRDQLWGEACVRYRQREPWWLDTDELTKLATDEQDDRYEQGVWDEIILKWIENPTPRMWKDDKGDEHIIEPYNSRVGEVRIEDILVHAIGKRIEMCGQPDRTQVARCLEHVGWAFRRIRTGENNKPVRFYVRDKAGE